MVENPFSLGVNLQVGSGEALEANWSKLTTRNWLEIYNSDAQKFNRSRGNGVIHTVNISPFLILAEGVDENCGDCPINIKNKKTGTVCNGMKKSRNEILPAIVTSESIMNMETWKSTLRESKANCSHFIK